MASVFALEETSRFLEVPLSAHVSKLAIAHGPTHSFEPPKPRTPEFLAQQALIGNVAQQQCQEQAHNLQQ